MIYLLTFREIIAMTKNEKGLFKYQTLSDRERKSLAILDIIRKKGPISRTDISKLTGLNIVTISNYVNEYINKNLVIERGLDVSSGGRKPTLIELDAKNGFVIGVDISPNSMIAILTDLVAKPINKVKKLRPSGHMEEVIKKSIDLIQELMDTSKVDIKNIKGIGLGISGVISEDAGTIRDTDPARGFTSGSYLTICSTIEDRFKIPTFIGNDATCAAFGEKRLAIDEEIENMLYIYSDVGLGIIIKGDIYCGASGSAGEIQVAPGQEGKFGLDEKGLSYLRPHGIDLGIVENSKKLAQNNAQSKVLKLANNNLENVTLDLVIKAAEEGDKQSIELIENAGINLGARVAYLINLFNPEIVVVGGGVEKARELILGPIRKTVRKLAFEEPATKARIIGSLLGEEAIALGAASLVLREIFINV